MTQATHAIALRLAAGLSIALIGSAALAAAPAPPVAIHAHNVDIVFQGHISVHLVDVSARLMPTPGAALVNLEDADSFTIDAIHGCARLSGDQLATLFNQRILAYQPRSLNDVRFTPGDGTMQVRGGAKLWHRVPPFWLPFRATTDASVDDRGLIALTVSQEHAVGLPVSALLDVAHLRLAGLLDLDRPGVRVVGDTVRIDTRHVLPGPSLAARPTQARLTRAGLTVCFDGASPDKQAPPPGDVPADISAQASYLWARADALSALGQRIAPARLWVRPANDTPLVFRLIHSRDQIARGDIRLAPNGRLIITPGPLNGPSASADTASD